jgi:hypothetical protein
MRRNGDDAPTTDGRGGSGRRAGASGEPGVDEPARADAAAPAPDAAPATPLDLPGRFEAGAELGRGGMGRVVEAYDRQLGRTVAIKEATEADADAQVRFAREVRITAQLQHPGIVPLYEAGRGPGGAPYYVMRKVTGQTLRDRVEAAVTPSERLALVPSVLAACDAVAYAHSRGILHRDLKPANILVGEHGETVVIDWGIAKAIDEEDSVAVVPPRLFAGLTSFGAVVGTPGYMAPEQERGEPVDRSSDVYALGATLAHVLTGAAVEGRPGALPDAVPVELAAIVGKALAADATQRYPDAGVLAADLRRFLTGQLVAAHRYSRRQRLRRFARRHRAALVVAAGAAIALVTTVTVALRNVLGARDQAEASARVALVARAEAERRTEAGLLARAEALLDIDPTRAAITAASLPLGSPLWPQARGILESARRAGLTRLYPVPGHGHRVRVHPAREELMAAPSDGPIYLVDLPTGRRRSVPGTDAANGVAWYDAGTAVVLTKQGAVRIVDLDGQVRRELATGDENVTMASAQDRPALAYATGAGVYLVEDGATPRRLGLDHSTGSGWLGFSPDGRWLAWWAADHGATLWDLRVPDPRPRSIAAAPVFDVSFSPDSSLVAVADDHELVEYTLADLTPSRRWQTPTPGAITLLHLGAIVVGLEPLRGVVRYHSGGMAHVASLEVSLAMAGWQGTDSPGFAFTNRTGVQVLGGGRSRRLLAPTLGVTSLATTSRGQLLAGRTSSSAVAVWRLDGDLAPTWSSARPGTTVPLDDDLLLNCQVDCILSSATGQWPDRLIDLRLAMLQSVLAAPWSDVAVASLQAMDGPGHLVIDRSTQAMTLLAPEAFELITLAGRDGVAITKSGRVGVLRPLGDGSVRELGRVEGTILAVTGSRDAVGVSTAEGTLARFRLADGTHDEAQVAPGLGSSLSLGSTGVIHAARGATLVQWRPGATPVEVATLSSSILYLVHDTRDETGLAVVAYTEDGSVHYVDASGAVRTTSAPTLLGIPSLSWGGVVAGSTAGNEVLRIDARDGIVQRLPTRSRVLPVVSPSGRTMLLPRDGGVDGYVDDLPTHPLGLRAWLATTTNARLAPDGVSMTWADPTTVVPGP